MMAGALYDDPNRECVGLAPIWGGAGTDNVANASGATAGAPGTWTPAGADAPTTSAQASAWGVVANPASAWTVGQYVQGSTAGAPGEMTWTGSAWVGGRAPAGDLFDPGAHTIADVQSYVEAHPVERVAVYEAELAGKARSTLLDWLDSYG